MRVKSAQRFALILFLVFASADASAGLFSFCSDWLKGTPSATDQELRAHDEEVWARITPSLQTELQTFTALSSPEKKTYLEKVSSEFAKKYEDRELGAHYNLHGGMRRDYIDRGGISFSMGDSGLEHGFSRDTRLKIYFFNLKQTSLYETLNPRNPNQVYFKMRYGNVLTIFDVKKVREFLNTTYHGAIDDDGSIFSLHRDARVTTRAVAAEFYAAPPIAVFDGYRKRFGRRLSWDDETLVTMRLIDAHLQSK